MSTLSEYYEITIKLIHLLENQNLDRDERISMMDALLNRRDSILTGIKAPQSDGEKELFLKCNELNTKLVKLMQNEKRAIQGDIKSLSLKKKSNHKYSNPYANLQMDGVYYDKKN